MMLSIVSQTCFHSCNSLYSLLLKFILNITILLCYLVVFMTTILMASNSPMREFYTIYLIIPLLDIYMISNFPHF